MPTQLRIVGIYSSRIYICCSTVCLNKVVMRQVDTQQQSSPKHGESDHAETKAEMEVGEAARPPLVSPAKAAVGGQVGMVAAPRVDVPKPLQQLTEAATATGALSSVSMTHFQSASFGASVRRQLHGRLVAGSSCCYSNSLVRCQLLLLSRVVEGARCGGR